MASAEVIDRARDLLVRLSRKPRFAGSSEETAVRALCRAELEHAGFECRELAFDYSQWPGRWGTPVAATVQAAAIFLMASMADHTGPFSALLLGGGILGALLLALRGARRRWVSAFPLQRASAVNLEATRGTPSLWLVAHLDSKSQTVPMLLRIASAIALNAITALTFLVLLLDLGGLADSRDVWWWVVAAAWVAAIPSILCFVRNESPGAVDNASGVAAVLLAAQEVPRNRSLGVLLTSAEELGLAGARAWAERARSEAIMINCDTIDESGAWLCMYTGRRPRKLLAGVETTAGRLRLNLRSRRLIPGILADSIAFADKGLQAVTVSRGTLSTLARIHTRRDNSAALTGSGVAEGSALLAALARELG